MGDSAYASFNILIFRCNCGITISEFQQELFAYTPHEDFMKVNISFDISERVVYAG